MKEKLFLIRPIRGISESYKDAIETQRKFYEQTYDVYDPERDTDQNGNSLRICINNANAMEKCDVVAVIWDGESQGCLFDLGMAFAMRKRIIPVTGYFPRMTETKSFQNMVWSLDEYQSDIEITSIEPSQSDVSVTEDMTGKVKE